MNTFQDLRKDKFIPLNLPEFNYCIEEKQGQLQIYDPFRLKYVSLTPEEWVRQHFLHYLSISLGYPKQAIAVEVPIAQSLRADRADALVYGLGGVLLALLEFKAPQVSITQQVLAQISRYNLYLAAPYLMISNGLQHSVFKTNTTLKTFEPLSHIPDYKELITR